MSEKADTVAGLGFKDEEKAMETLKILEGRDPEYQKLAVKGLIGRAKRVLTLTKDKDKLQNINDAMKIFGDFLEEYDKTGKAKENRSYLPLATVQTFLPLKKKYEIEDKDADDFLKAYKSVKGEYKNLRTVKSNDKSWDIIRNSSLKAVEKRNDNDDLNLWDDDDLPTKEHMEMIVWAYSPDASKIKKNLSKIADKLGKQEEDDSSEDEEMSENGKEKKTSKRKSEDSSSASDEESPKKKSKH